MEALAGIFGEGFEDDGGEGSGDLWIELAWIGRGLFDVRFVDGEGVALEGEAVGEDFKYTDAEGVDIGLCGSFAAEEDLGCDVIGGADVSAFEGEPSAARDKGEAKVDQFDLTVAGDEDVGGFEIAVQDAFAVGVCKSIKGLSKDRDGGLGAESLATPKHGVDVASVDELHHHKQAISFVEEIVQGDEVGVIQSSHRTGFLDEALAKTGITFEIRRERFDGDGLTGEDVGGLKDLSHAAFAYLFLEDVVLSDAMAGFELWLVFFTLLASDFFHQRIDSTSRLFFERIVVHDRPCVS